MSPLQHSNNLAARMGRWSARHWKTAVFGWLAFVIAAVAIGQAVGQKTVKQQDTNVGQAHRADQILAQAGFGQSDPQTEIVLVQSKHLTIGDAAFRSTVAGRRAGRRAVDRRSRTSARRSRRRTPISSSKDRHSALVEWDMKGTRDRRREADRRADARRRPTVAKAHPGLYVGEAGSVSSTKALNAEFGKQLGPGGRAVDSADADRPAARLRHAGRGVDPAAAGADGRDRHDRASSRSRATPSRWTATSAQSCLLVGLAVGVDYTLFYVKREREERAAGRGHRAALEAAAATSGRSVLISGFTVMVAMAGMFLTRDKTFMSFSVATMLVVGVAMIGSLTVLPAILSKLGDRVEKGRIPFLGRLRRQGGENRVWAQGPDPGAQASGRRGRRVDRRARRARRAGAQPAHRPVGSRLAAAEPADGRDDRPAAGRPSSARPTRRSSRSRPRPARRRSPRGAAA